MIGEEGHNDRVVFWSWDSVARDVEPDEVDASTVGQAFLTTREEPGYTWGPPRDMGEVPYGVWCTAIEQDGFVYFDRYDAAGNNVAKGAVEPANPLDLLQ